MSGPNGSGDGNGHGPNGNGGGAVEALSALEVVSAMEAVSAVEAVSTPEAVGAVLVCGAGITGIQASLDLAESGFKVYLVDSTAAIGGRMAQLDKTFPTGDCATCIVSPKLVECIRDYNIDVLTMADVVDLEGGPGHFTVRVRKRPRSVKAASCTGCGDCWTACA